MKGQTPDLSGLSGAVHDAEETVRAISQGAVDAVVVQGRNGPQIVTLTGADEPYRILVERMSEGAMTVSAEGLVLYVNRRLAEMAGRAVGEIVGQEFATLFSGDIPAIYRDWMPPADGITHVVNLIRSTGDALPVSVWAGPVAIADEPATLVTITDLTSQRRAEEIAVAERFARSILEQATDPIVVLSPDGLVVRASRAAEQLAGRAPIGRRFSESFQLEPAALTPEGLAAKFKSTVIDGLLATRPFHGIEVRLSGGPRDRTFLLSAGPLLDETKNSVGSIVTLTDITARKRAEEQQTTMVAELNHRVKNILAIVQSIAQQTVRNVPTLDAFQDTFGGRLKALAVAHDILTRTRWRDVGLNELLEQTLAPYVERVRLAGDPILLASQTVVPLSMVLHELMTNAAKYGALSATGRLELTWEKADGAVRLHWTERGGPALPAKITSGFGTKLIERVTTYDLDGEAKLDYQPAGLVCTLTFHGRAEREPTAEVSAFATHT